ncbi:phospholipid/cholesterol/gamma-HCH transport system substrate-binding protein [Anaerospora hongkongensis]|uniref:Phospholipid/cholesterol/gamma-HCH transport system substrate-binding protein n=1 Tax=Anaerospora hongkongensis TaxID=244830 RepID=A0A4R1PNL6_9FIRM|nr:MlaD family protein [Anaerospora hongkongensis]TCL32959.1 phospholipid/cholesterol/gamma-HCH transport system substrate-binding protein [Anaerospora hongkongensis]
MNVTTEAKVGAVTLIALLLLGFMVVHIGGFSFGDKGYPVQAVFSQVGGLKEGNVVRYAGVDVGRVQQVHVIPEGVKVLLLINPDTKIPEGSHFTIGTDGLLGEKFINITPPAKSSGFLEPNTLVRGEEPQGLDTLISNADKVLADIQKLVQSLNEVIGDEKVKTALKETMLNSREITANLNRLSASLARMAESNEQDTHTMITNLAAMSESLRDVAGRVDNMLTNLDNNGQTAADVREMISNLKTTSSRVEKMAAALEGVVTDPESSRNIKDTLKNAREASEKANKMLNSVSNIETEVNAELLYNTDSGNYQSNAAVKISTSPKEFAVVGVTHIGENEKLNLQMGKKNGSFASRAGIMEGKAGIGFDANTDGPLKLSVDVYDPNDVRYKLRSEFQLAPDVYLVGQRTKPDSAGESGSYVGIRHTF